MKYSYMRALFLGLMLFLASAYVVQGVQAKGRATLVVHRPLTADSVRVNHDADSVQVVMRITLPYDVDSHEVELLEVHLVNGADSVALPSVGVYGRLPYYTALRSGLYLFQDPQRDILLRRKDSRREGSFVYARSVARSEWMEGAVVKLHYTRHRCCGALENVRDWQVSEVRTMLQPDTVRSTVTRVQEKSGVMHVDFVLDSITIRPSYHDNRRELEKLDSDLSALLSDGSKKILGVTLHGYASPEGPYRHNAWLAQHRTEALKQYVAERHPQLDSTLVAVRSTAEDWDGLRLYVEQSSLPHREEILAVIDDTVARPDPDARLRYIRRQYKEDFADIFDKTLPYLRHTDYTIRYTYTEEHTEETVIPSRPAPSEPMHEVSPLRPAKTLRPLFAVKTNLLLDLAAWPNVEVEVPIGRKARWSVMAEWGSPWYVWRHNSRAYQILNLGIEARRWLSKCDDCRPVLTGGFLGVYACGGKYDIQRQRTGDQGEYCSIGLSGGYSWVLGKCWNLEVSGSVGVLFGPKRHYSGEFGDTHLIWLYNDHLFYAGPTQVKVSLVWLLPRHWFGLTE